MIGDGEPDMAFKPMLFRREIPVLTYLDRSSDKRFFPASHPV